MTRRRRGLDPEERRLWVHVTRGVRPMPGKSVPEEMDDQPAVVAPPQPKAAQPLARLVAPVQKPSPPPLAPLERKTLKALRRGSRAVDRVIDLHGMRQAEAHVGLIGFLRRAQMSGDGLVLVITGKGGAGSGGVASESGLFEERGILRRMVPLWLRLPEMRALVIGFEEASPHHGGSGALYVRLRRARGTD